MRLLYSLGLGIANLVVALVGIPILAVLLLFIPRGKESLPKAFRWWDNGEAYFKAEDEPDGLLGPHYWRKKRGVEDQWAISYWKLWWERFNWLALRNPADYFGYKLGFKVVDKLTRVKSRGNENVGDHLWSDQGYFYQLVYNGNGKKYWEYYLVYKYYRSNYALRVRIGWKIGAVKRRNDGRHLPFVFSITPFKEIN